MGAGKPNLCWGQALGVAASGTHTYICVHILYHSQYHTTPTNKMAFILQPALVEDAEAITDIFEKAFADDYIMQHMRPNVPKEVQWQKDLEWVRGWFEQAAAYGARITKVVENDTGYNIPIVSNGVFLQ